jgi:hypothetical protein
MSLEPTDHPSFHCRFEPTTLTTALAARTTHVGLGAPAQISPVMAGAVLDVYWDTPAMTMETRAHLT